MKRPFWMHQVVEYIIGVGLLAQALQAPKPALPAIGGGLVLVNAAVTHGPLGAFKLLDRQTHRVGDVVVVVLMVAMGVLGGSSVDSSGRVLLIGGAALLGFVTLRTDYTERSRSGARAAGAAVGPAAAGGSASRGEDIGRFAGRMTGAAVRTWRRRRS
jgi:hypothetical protein